MNFGPLEPFLDVIQDLTDGNKVSGVRYAKVLRIEDEGYILEWISSNDEMESAPARVATLMAGGERGTFFYPEPEDEVVVAFEGGDVDRPVIIGALWSDVDTPPADADISSSNNLRIIRTRLGHQLTFDDTQGAGKVCLKSAGEHSIEMDDAAKKLTIKTPGSLKIEMNAKVPGSETLLISLNDSTYIELSSAGVTIKGQAINLN